MKINYATKLSLVPKANPAQEQKNSSSPPSTMLLKKSKKGEKKATAASLNQSCKLINK